jgi:hypothetical protein
VVLKDRIRIKQFFIDFDRLRKGTVGEAAVSQAHNHSLLNVTLVQNMLGYVKLQVHRRRNPVTDL